MDKVFVINGREVKDYQLRNTDILSLLEKNDISAEDREYLTQRVLDIFKYDLCPRKDEDNEDQVFVRFFSDFVNGKMWSKEKTAEGLARQHRYLQQQMFYLFLEYAKVLAENADKGYYDARNEYSCKVSKEIIDNLKEKKLII